MAGIGWGCCGALLVVAVVAATGVEDRALGGSFFGNGFPSWSEISPFQTLGSKWPFQKPNSKVVSDSTEDFHSGDSQRGISSHIDSDDIFNGLSDVWNNKNEDTLKEHVENDSAEELPQLPDHYYHDLSTKAQSIPTFNNFNANPTTEKDLETTLIENDNNLRTSSEPSHAYDENTVSLLPVDSIQDHWTRLKSILENMKGILEREFSGANTDEKLTFAIIDKVISFGDKMDILKRLNKAFNNGLVSFLTHRWMDISESIINGSPVLKTLFSINTGDLTNSLMIPLLKNVGHFFKSHAFKHLKDLDFVTNLMKTSGFQENEINEVFNLLDLNSDHSLDVDNNLQPEGEGRQYSSNTFMEKSGGYGHSGGYGGGGGYASHGGGGYMMQTIDPFVLLAGLAFATFLAFLLFRLLSVTAGRRRSVPDMSINLDLSDTPEVMSNIYHFLDSAEKKFGSNGTGIGDPIERFGSSANSLWTTFQVDRLERSCMRRYLCETAEEATSIDSSESTTALHQLAITALAQLLGEDQGAKMVDGIQQHMMDGSPQECRTVAPHCDDALYATVAVPHAVSF